VNRVAKLKVSAILAFVTVVASAMFAAPAQAFPTKTTPCSGCHSGVNVPVTATLSSVTAVAAIYNVSAPAASAIAVFGGTTKLFVFSATSAQFSVAPGKTYNIFAVKGPTTSDGLGSTSVSPVAPVVDSTAPVTTSDAKATYVSTATIKLTATDAGTGVAATYYKLDGAAQVAGTSISSSVLGAHTLEFWSVDVAGNIETPHKTAAFTITAPPDITAPVTTSDAKATYVSSATIKLTATDAGTGVAATYYRLDSGAQLAGTTVTVSTLGAHTLQFWSVDVAGNIELYKTAAFTITAPPDTTAPATTSDAKATYVSGAVVTLAATDAGSGVASTYYKLDGAAQVAGTSIITSALGSHTLEFWSVDVAGNIETPHKTAAFSITAPPVADTTAPVTTSDAKATYVSTATVKLTGTDTGSGVAATYYKLDNGVQTAGTSVTSSVLGSHTLEFWSVDVAGNIETPHKTAAFSITAPPDITAPVTISDAKAAYVSTATIKLTATDAGTGVAATYYKLDGAAQVAGTSVGSSVLGSHTLEFWSVDVAGNIETPHKTAAFSITPPPDITAPVTTSDAKSVYLSNAVIKLTATDASSGVAATYYKLDNGGQTAGTSTTTSAIGSHTLEFWSVDGVGNIETPHKTATFSVTPPPDTTAPTTTSNAVATYYYSAVIQFTATDVGSSGVAHTYYVLDSAAQAEGTAVNVSTAGSHTVQFWSVDASANVEAPRNSASFEVTIPPTPPTPVYRFYNNNNGSHFYTVSEAERDIVVAKWLSAYTLEGVAFSINTLNPANNTPLYRFFNKVNGSHFYTASEAEKAAVIAKMSATYSYDGPAYNICTTHVAGATTIYRFYNKLNGTHFYTASETEKNYVLANLSATYSLDGPAYYLAP